MGYRIKKLIKFYIYIPAEIIKFFTILLKKSIGLHIHRVKIFCQLMRHGILLFGLIKMGKRADHGAPV
ncbi:hypothetical protein ADN01_02125 [Levilinea saccharolytica]|uniref:Uncharacterized protein n=1 Tax=Levilinea saccharolytica TaxID=229921 RepID=A0A0P6Y0I2_9CHLR|nr:hypothetical protein ADN01_02125 [Levilinea saccharolytica]